MANQNLIQDDNQFPAIIAHSGTAGTAETRKLTSQNTPGALDVHIAGTSVDIGGGGGGTNVNIVTGTQQTLGTVGTILGLGGTVAVSGITSGTVVEVEKGTITTGTLAAVTSVSNLVKGTITKLEGGTVQTNIETGTVTLVSNLNSGSVRVTVGTINTGTVSVTVGTIVGPTASGGTPTTAPVLVAGTDATGTVYAPKIDANGIVTVSGAVTLGTLAGLGTVTNVGSLTNVGTIKEVANLATGTIAAVTSVSNLVKGTITKVEGGTLGEVTLVPTVTTVSNLTTGSIIVTSGTLGSVGAVAQVHNAGTIQAGTIQINPVPVPTTVIQGTLGTAGGSFFGTLSAASGAGTKHYISGLQIVVQSGTPDVRILAGTSIQGTGFLGGGAFPPGGGIMRDFTVPYATGTNSELIYHFVSAGTALISVNYWKGT